MGAYFLSYSMLSNERKYTVLQDKKDAYDDNNDNTNNGISDDDADLPPGPILHLVVDLTKQDPISTSVVVRT